MPVSSHPGCLTATQGHAPFPLTCGLGDQHGPADDFLSGRSRIVPLREASSYSRTVDVNLSPEDSALVASAEEIVSRCSDGLNHTTAAAALADDGRIATGLNVYHFTGGPCAELVVIGSAAADGIRGLRAIAAVGDGGRGVLNPCGRCRQVLLDYYPDIRVVVSTGSACHAVPITDLLPWGNRWDQESGTQPVGAGS